MSSTVEEGERKTRKDSSEGRREEEETRDARVRFFPAVMRDDVCQKIIAHQIAHYAVPVVDSLVMKWKIKLAGCFVKWN